MRPVFVAAGNRRCGGALLAAVVLVLAVLILSVWILRNRRQAVPEPPMHDRSAVPAESEDLPNFLDCKPAV